LSDEDRETPELSKNNFNLPIEFNNKYEALFNLVETKNEIILPKKLLTKG